jgi:hypothetical protein
MKLFLVLYIAVNRLILNLNIKTKAPGIRMPKMTEEWQYHVFFTVHTHLSLMSEKEIMFGSFFNGGSMDTN